MQRRSFAPPYPRYGTGVYAEHTGKLNVSGSPSEDLGYGIVSYLSSIYVTSSAFNNAIPTNGVVRVTLSATPARAVARGDYLVGFASGGSVSTTTAKVGTSGTLPSITSTSIAAGRLVFGAFGYEDGTALLTADTDTNGGSAWSSAATQQSGTSGLTGLSVFRQYKWIATAATQTFDSTTATPSSADWVAMLLSIG